jgi:hypothetical protein
LIFSDNKVPISHELRREWCLRQPSSATVRKRALGLACRPRTDHRRDGEAGAVLVPGSKAAELAEVGKGAELAEGLADASKLSEAGS